MNPVIETIIKHKSIRKFKETPLSKEQVELLVTVAQHTSTSSFMQSYSIIGVTDPIKKQQLAEVGNQPYIAEAGHLFVFIADLNRNKQIAEKNEKDTTVLESTDRFLVGFTDASLAAQTTLLAAESLGLGGVFLGSLLNNAEKVIEILELPTQTFPVVGLAVGYPDQEPQLKPRLPMAHIYHENTYKVQSEPQEALADYDSVVTEYYDLRNANTRIDSFTNQATKSMDLKHPGRMKLLEMIHAQNLLKY
ncbi:oxygen-insensitive NADPH nitroreductase [Carnobacterium maltaromaticum]|uniref:oxygen-insensitive NADPH nitroreductase n=1 Tax=Carnobacterium maltaromaticum TaxID=2751 RepID=UPI00295E27B8|nr:oxygen-insensitive NADPH nitroreductase [Carnobacterium maltaromaticum]